MKTALVTGSGRGIGRSIATRLADDGYSVIVNYRDDRASAESLFDQLPGTGHFALQADASDATDAVALVSAAEAAAGRLDVVVNNVGDFVLGPMSAVSAEAWDAVIASNLSSAFYVSSAALPGMRKQGQGNIVNVGMAPMYKNRAASNLAPYAIAKMGIDILTRSMASEEAKAGIRINCVAPGLVDNGHLSAAELEWMKSRLPAERVGEPDDIASAVAFLLSEEASYVSGATLAVSGGWDWDGRPETAVDDVVLRSGGAGQRSMTKR